MKTQLQPWFRLVTCGRGALTPRVSGSGAHVSSEVEPDLRAGLAAGDTKKRARRSRSTSASPARSWLSLALMWLGLALTAALVAVLSARAEENAAPAGMVLVPAGEFLMGSDDGNFDERPAHRVQLPAYYIDRNEVTVGEFDAFVRATDGYDAIEGPWFRVSTAACVAMLAHFEKRYGVPFAQFKPSQPTEKAAAEKLTQDALRWKATVAALRVLLGKDRMLADATAQEIAKSPAVQTLMVAEARMPVRFIAWRDASSYARWAGKRLPTEAEWEKAARGTDGRIYPWGNEWDQAKARAGLEVEDGPTTAGNFAAGVSPYGCLDMSGNVWEWCEDWFGEFYYQECADGVVDPKGPTGLPNGELPKQDPSVHYIGNARKQGRETDTRKIVRGGCWAGGKSMIGQTEFNNRCSRRMWSNPNYWSEDTGFRCAKDASP